MKQSAEEALALANKMRSEDGISIALKGLSLHYFYHKQYKKAFELTQQSYDTALKYKNVANTYKAKVLLSDIALAEQNFSLYDDLRVQADSLQEAINETEYRRNVADIEKKYETEKKEAQIKLQQAQLKQKKLLNYLLGGGALALLLISLFG